jgi:hypothetical protein
MPILDTETFTLTGEELTAICEGVLRTLTSTESLNGSVRIAAGQQIDQIYGEHTCSLRFVRANYTFIKIPFSKGTSWSEVQKVIDKCFKENIGGTLEGVDIDRPHGRAYYELEENKVGGSVYWKRHPPQGLGYDPEDMAKYISTLKEHPVVSAWIDFTK